MGLNLINPIRKRIPQIRNSYWPIPITKRMHVEGGKPVIEGFDRARRIRVKEDWKLQLMNEPLAILRLPRGNEMEVFKGTYHINLIKYEKGNPGTYSYMKVDEEESKKSKKGEKVKQTKDGTKTQYGYMQVDGFTDSQIKLIPTGVDPNWIVNMVQRGRELVKSKNPYDTMKMILGSPAAFFIAIGIAAMLIGKYTSFNQWLMTTNGVKLVCESGARAVLETVGSGI